MLGDSAYPCISRLIVPFKDNGRLTRVQRKFNQKLSSCRVVVENAFGCLKQRFRQLYHFKLQDIPRMVLVIHACCVLHNMANIEDMQLFETHSNDEEPDLDVQDQHMVNEPPRDQETGVYRRNQLCLLNHA